MTTTPLQSVGHTDLAQIGGKAASLGELIRIGQPVPQAFVVTTDAYRSGLSDAISHDILNHFDNLRCERVAVRSSAVAEDAKGASWAGQLESYLNVQRDGLTEAISDCWQSMDSARAEGYARHNHINRSDRAVAVLVQKMVDSEVAGVMFTANPVTQDRNQIVIEAVRGLGELLVQGEETPESLIADKATGAVFERVPSRQVNMMVYKDGRNTLVSVSDILKQAPLLSPDLCRELIRRGVEIETRFKAPQDIEWAVENGRLYILQSRPITTLQPFR
jgi:phosphoenolpyruvate synthase/pyruvate phosphate dikinase